MWMHQELLLPNILKLFVFTGRCYGKIVLLAAYFKVIIVIAMIKIFEKYIWSSILEKNFQKLFASVFI